MVPDLAKYPTHGIFFQAPLGIVTDDSTNQTAYGTKYGSMDNLLNTWGYFIQTGKYDERPSFISDKITPKRWRSRLMELRVPSEKMGQYDLYTTDTTNDWFQTLLTIPQGQVNPPRPVRVLAENVTALIIWPKLPKQEEDARTALTGVNAQSVLCPYYAYNSNTKIDASVTPQRPFNRNPGVNWNANLNDDVIEKGGINPINQLPPVVQVAMIAIDERSAKWLAELGHYDAPTFTEASATPHRFHPRLRSLEKLHSRLQMESVGDRRLGQARVGLARRIGLRSQQIRVLHGPGHR